MQTHLDSKFTKFKVTNSRGQVPKSCLGSFVTAAVTNSVNLTQKLILFSLSKCDLYR